MCARVHMTCKCGLNLHMLPQVEAAQELLDNKELIRELVGERGSLYTWSAVVDAQQILRESAAGCGHQHQGFIQGVVFLRLFSK